MWLDCGLCMPAGPLTLVLPPVCVCGSSPGPVGERPAAEGEGGRGPGPPGCTHGRAGQRGWRRRGQGLERGGAAAAYQSGQPVPSRNQRQVRCSHQDNGQSGSKLGSMARVSRTPGQAHSLSWYQGPNRFLDSNLILSFRWEVIANYMNLHSTSGNKRTAKDVINKAKNLQKLGNYTHSF